MKRYFLLFCLIFAAGISSAQTKYFVYFKDKGIQPNALLSKSTDNYLAAKALLSERAIERRKRTMGSEFITFEDLPISVEYLSALEKLNIKIVHKLKWLNAVSAIVPPGKLESLASMNFVSEVQPVRSIKNSYSEKIDFADNALLKSGQFGGINYGPSFTQLQLSEIPAVHKMGLSGKNILIGLLDTGFKWKNNPAVENVNVLGERDFVFGDLVTENEAEDDKYQHNHGSYVLSIAAAKLEGQLVGPAFNADFYLAKTEDVRTERNIEEDNYAAGIEWLENQGVDITSSSLGYSEFDDGEHSYTYADMNGKTTVVAKAAELAFKRGVLVISSAGNEGNKSWNYIISPADGEHVLAAGAVSSSGTVASFSSRGPTSDGRIKPDLMTMGSSTAFAYPTGQVAFGGGTSFSAPILCGISALLLEAHPYLNNEQLRHILIESGDRTADPDTAYGYGISSALRAVTFPNMELIGGLYRIHKIFADSTGIDKLSIKLNLGINGSSFSEFALSQKDSIHFYYDLPAIADADSLSFFFTYSDNSGTTFREPKSGSFKVSYGSLIVRDRFSEPLYIPSENSLSYGFPNPFVPAEQQHITFNMNTKEDGSAEINIFNVLGQHIEKINLGVLKAGVNFVRWNGRGSSGSFSSSGVYIAELKFNDEVFRRKFVLLR